MAFFPFLFSFFGFVVVRRCALVGAFGCGMGDGDGDG